jgi:hypothetical protein
MRPSSSHSKDSDILDRRTVQMTDKARVKVGDTRSSLAVSGVMVFLLVCSPSASAQSLRTGGGIGGQPGVVRTLSGFAAVPGTWTISAHGSYGWQPDLLVEGDAEHSSWGRLALSYAPWSFLQAAISIDQFVALYLWPDADGGSLVLGAVGDPRISLRSGWDLGRGFSMAGQFELLIPAGTGAYDIIGSSLSPAVDVAITFAPDRIPLGVHLQVGYHHDRTGVLAESVEWLTPEQLAVSGITTSMHHLAYGLGLEYRIRAVAPFVEVTGDVPLDTDGPAHSWLVIGFGARLWLGRGDAVQLLLALEIAALRADPEPDPATARVWDSPPLLNVLLGLTVRLPIRGEEAAPECEGETGDGGAPDTGRPAPGRISGRVLCGIVPCAAVTTVEVVGSGASPFTVDAEQGTFVTSELQPGAYRVVARSGSADERSANVTVVPGATVETTISFPEVAPPASGIRGRVTDFNGVPLQARVRIPELDVEVQANAEGQFEVDVPPGQYQVVIWTEGFATQTTRVEVTNQGVVVMNIELRRQRR